MSNKLRDKPYVKPRYADGLPWWAKVCWIVGIVVPLVLLINFLLSHVIVVWGG